MLPLLQDAGHEIALLCEFDGLWREYRNQAARLKALRGYQLILTASEHMRAEYLKYGFRSETVRRVSLPLIDCLDSRERPRTENAHLPSRVAFVGRMEYLKGGPLLIDAMCAAAVALNRPLTITFAGDGRERATWEERARAAQARDSRFDFSFVGWLKRSAVADLLGHSDLLALPSIWPELFSLVGLEAGLRGVPTAAFRVGGIPEWLDGGVNGHLAPSDPPTATGLATAIAKCLSDPSEHARLSCNARETALRFSAERHLAELLLILHEVAGQ
jgi:glycosyltransferase involved in cell wall biosynthesis